MAFGYGPRSEWSNWLSDRFLNLHLKRGAVNYSLCVASRAREGGPRPAVSIRAARSYGDFRREPIETAGRGVAVAYVRSGISGWVIGLLIRGRAGPERRAANEGKQGDC